MTLPIGAIVIVDVNKEQSAVKEAASMGVPIVGLVDTNSDPSLVDFVIPANDDSPQSINLIINYLGDAILRGKELAAKRVKNGEAPTKSGKVAEEAPAIVEVPVPDELDII